MAKFTDTWKTDVNLFFYDKKLSNCPFSSVRQIINSCVCLLIDDENMLLRSERARIFAVNVKKKHFLLVDFLCTTKAVSHLTKGSQAGQDSFLNKYFTRYIKDVTIIVCFSQWNRDVYTGHFKFWWKKTRVWQSYYDSDFITFEKLRFQSVFCPQVNANPAFSNSSCLKAPFSWRLGVDGRSKRRNVEMDRAVWTHNTACFSMQGQGGKARISAFVRIKLSGLFWGEMIEARSNKIFVW